MNRYYEYQKPFESARSQFSRKISVYKPTSRNQHKSNDRITQYFIKFSMFCTQIRSKMILNHDLSTEFNESEINLTFQ